jgi:hypothetical protein
MEEEGVVVVAKEVGENTVSELPAAVAPVQETEEKKYEASSVDAEEKDRVDEVLQQSIASSTGESSSTTSSAAPMSSSCAIAFVLLIAAWK